MAVKKFYSNKAKAGWRENPNFVPVKNIAPGQKQKDSQKKYFSWGYDIDLEPESFNEHGKPKRNRQRESGFASKQLAEAATGRLRLAEKNKKYDLVDYQSFPLVAELFQKRLRTISEHQEKIRAKRVLQLLLDCLDDAGFTNLRINNLTTQLISLYTERRRGQVSDDTINRELRVVRATLNQSHNLYSGLENWIPPKVNFLKVDKRRRERVLQSTEVQIIVSQMMKPQTENETENIFLSRQRAGLLFALSAVTGARPGELTALKEDDILFDLNVLRITGKKTRFKTAKTVRYFPLLNIVCQILAKALEIKLKEFIFTHCGTLTQTYYNNVKMACEAVGLKYGRKVIGGMIPYDLRHTATTLLVQSGADFETVTNLTGQSRHSLWHYTHASAESINRAAAVLGNFGEKSMEFSNNGLSLDTNTELTYLKRLITTNKN